jgi:hypothetical protein
MDLLDRVRELGAGSEPAETSIDNARATLALAIADAPAEARRRTRWGIGIGSGAGLLVAAAATTAIVVVVSGTTAITSGPAPTSDTAATQAPSPDVTLAPAPDPIPAITAASVLENAAIAAGTSVAPLGADQFIRVENQTEQLVTYAEGVDQLSPYNATRDNATAAWVARGSYSTYIPADRAGEWVRVFEPGREIVGAYGEGADALAAQWLGTALTERIVNRYQGGLDLVGDTPIYASDAYFAAIPREPEALLAWHRDRLAAGNVENLDEGVVAVLVQDLELNAAPPDLQAAMFRALALAEGVTIQSVDGPITTLAFPFTGNGRVRLATVSIDAATGQVAGSTTTSAGGNGLVPEGVPDFRVTTTVSVVDSAP